MIPVRLRQAAHVVALPVGVGLAVGALSGASPQLAILGVGAAIGGFFALRWPPLLIVGVFGGILMDRIGGLGTKIAGLPLTIAKLTVLGAIGGWALHCLVTGERPVRWHPVLTGLAGMVAASAITVAATGRLGDGRFVLYGLAMNAVLAGLMFVIAASRPMGWLARLLGGVLALAMVQSLAIGGRSSGTLGDPNEWAALVLMVTPLLLGVLAQDDHPISAPIRLALVGLLPMAVLSSGSRTALVVMSLVSLPLVYVMWRRRGELAVVGVIGAVVAPFVVSAETVLRRFGSLIGNLTGTAVIGDESLDERTLLVEQAVDLFLTHPIVGVGPGNYVHATGYISLQNKLRPAHNTYLEVASEQGLVGLVPLFAFMGIVAWTLGKAFRDAPDVAQRRRIAGAAAGLGAFALMAATLGLMTFSMAFVALGLMLAVVTRGADRGA